VPEPDEPPAGCTQSSPNHPQRELAHKGLPERVDGLYT